MRSNLSIIFLATLAVLAMGCAKFNSDEHESSGVYLNGSCIAPLGSTFISGGMVDPAVGTWAFYQLYEENLVHYPRGAVPTVTVGGNHYTGTTYSNTGQFIDGISIHTWALDLYVPLEQGVYKGGCEQVSSVRITNYDEGTNKNGDGKIDIILSLTDGQTLRIHYRGKVLSSGMY